MPGHTQVLLQKLCPEKLKGREKGKMKKTEGYIVRRLEDEYLLLPSGRRTEEVNEFSYEKWMIMSDEAF